MVIAYPVVVTKFLATITKGKKNLFCFMIEEEEQYIVAGKAWQEEPRLGGHIGLPLSGWVFSSQLKVSGNCLQGAHIQRCVS